MIKNAVVQEDNPSPTQVSIDAGSDADLAFAGVTKQAEMLRSREISSRELVNYYLDRIFILDQKLNAFRVILAEKALASADEAQDRLDAGDEAPLLGVPVAIKDDIDVEGESTMCGTGIDLGPATADSSVVRRIRKAGVVVIGKTNLPEFGAWALTESASWGISRNPWNLGRTPGGSSGGSAAAVASGCVGAALGTDGGGSIRIPAACCHLFGLKTQRGRVSTKESPGRDYQWHGMSQTGPLTRSVIDSAVINDAIIGKEENDPIPSPPPTQSFHEAALSEPRKLKIAISFKSPFPVPASDEVRVSVYEVAELLQGLGHEIKELDIDYGIRGIPAMFGLYMNKVRQEFALFHNHGRLERRTQDTLRISKLFGDRFARWALKTRETLTDRMNETFKDFDVLITPTLAKPPLEVGSWEGRGDTSTFLRMLSFTPFTLAANFTGQPAAAVPAGFTSDGLPLSVHLVGRTNDDATLVSLAAQIEAERPWAHMRPPISLLQQG